MLNCVMAQTFPLSFPSAATANLLPLEARGKVLLTCIYQIVSLKIWV